MALPDPGSLPPSDFASRDLPIETVPAGIRLFRIHRTDLSPLFFGSTGGNRFDDPSRTYGACYLAMTLEGAFAEACLRTAGARFVALTFLEARCFSEMEVTAPLRVVSVHGPGLARMGATAAVTSGPHGIAQHWSRAIHGHQTMPHGIAYRSNHDNGELCIALFDHARDRLAAGKPRAMTEDRVRLAELLARYKVGLG